VRISRLCGSGDSAVGSARAPGRTVAGTLAAAIVLLCNQTVSGYLLSRS
jgi:hypothetical protein